jgi:hypothetical protein
MFCFAVSCSKQAPKQGDTFGSSLTNYSISTFAKFQTFQGTVLNKYVSGFPDKSSGETNYHVVIVLEKNKGEKFAVSEDHASQVMLQIVNSLEENRIYTFPDVLTNGVRQGVRANNLQ